MPRGEGNSVIKTLIEINREYIDLYDVKRIFKFEEPDKQDKTGKFIYGIKFIHGKNSDQTFQIVFNSESARDVQLEALHKILKVNSSIAVLSTEDFIS